LKALHYTDIATQPSTRHALPRLAEQGRSHWYDGPIRLHGRDDIVTLFDALLAEATANGYGVERYTSDEPFGPVAKKSLAGYKGAPR
jgi:hypothetical protein